MKREDHGWAFPSHEESAFPGREDWADARGGVLKRFLDWILGRPPRCRAWFSEDRGLRIEIAGPVTRVHWLVVWVLLSAGMLVLLGWLAGRVNDHLANWSPLVFVPQMWSRAVLAVAILTLVFAVPPLWFESRREFIEIDGRLLTLSGRCFRPNPRRGQVLVLSRVSHLRYSPSVGSIAFEEDGRTYGFGCRLSEAESRRLIATIREYYEIPEPEALPIGTFSEGRFTLSFPSRGIRSEWQTDEAGGLWITIPGHPRILAIVAIAGAINLWWLIVLFVGSLPGADRRPANGMVALVGLFLAEGIWVLWIGAGREVIRIDDDLLVIRHQGGLPTGRGTRSYPMAELRNLRYAPVPARLGRRPRDHRSLAFDCGGKTVRFGDAVLEEEARRIVRTIKDRFPIPDDEVEPLPVEPF